MDYYLNLLCFNSAGERFCWTLNSASFGQFFTLHADEYLTQYVDEDGEFVVLGKTQEEWDAFETVLEKKAKNQQKVEVHMRITEDVSSKNVVESRKRSSSKAKAGANTQTFTQVQMPSPVHVTVPEAVTHQVPLTAKAFVSSTVTISVPSTVVGSVTVATSVSSNAEPSFPSTAAATVPSTTTAYPPGIPGPVPLLSDPLSNMSSAPLTNIFCVPPAVITSVPSTVAVSVLTTPASVSPIVTATVQSAATVPSTAAASLLSTATSSTQPIPVSGPRTSGVATVGSSVPLTPAMAKTNALQPSTYSVDYKQFTQYMDKFKGDMMEKLTSVECQVKQLACKLDKAERIQHKSRKEISQQLLAICDYHEILLNQLQGVQDFNSKLYSRQSVESDSVSDFFDEHRSFINEMHTVHLSNLRQAVQEHSYEKEFSESLDIPNVLQEHSKPPADDGTAKCIVGSSSEPNDGVAEVAEEGSASEYLSDEDEPDVVFRKWPLSLFDSSNDRILLDNDLYFIYSDTLKWNFEVGVPFISKCSLVTFGDYSKVDSSLLKLELSWASPSIKCDIKRTKVVEKSTYKVYHYQVTVTDNEAGAHELYYKVTDSGHICGSSVKINISTVPHVQNSQQPPSEVTSGSDISQSDKSAVLKDFHRVEIEDCHSDDSEDSSVSLLQDAEYLHRETERKEAKNRAAGGISLSGWQVINDKNETEIPVIDKTAKQFIKQEISKSAEDFEKLSAEMQKLGFKTASNDRTNKNDGGAQEQLGVAIQKIAGSIDTNCSGTFTVETVDLWDSSPNSSTFSAVQGWSPPEEPPTKE